MELILVVIRANQLDACHEFYTQLGLTFIFQQHGNGVFHFSARIGKTIFEIYPLQDGQTQADTSTRLGFTLSNFDAVIEFFQKQEGVVVSPPKQTEWGVSAVLKDPDGRKVEIQKSKLEEDVIQHAAQLHYKERLDLSVSAKEFHQK